MRYAAPLVACLLFGAVLTGCATTSDVVAAPAAPQFSAERLSADIQALSDDAMEGRGIATPAEAKVIDYLSRAYAQAGFQPGGDNGGWTQAVTLNRFTASNIEASLRVGDWSRPLAQGTDIVVSTRLPGQTVDLASAPLVFVGYGIRAPERNWDDYAGIDMRGKIAVVLINDADFEEPELDTFGGRAMTYYGRWTYKYEEAARQGAAGVIIVHETEPASYGWATVTNSWSGPQFDIVRQNAAGERVPVESWIQRDIAVQLFQRAGQDFEALKRQARQRGFRPVELQGAAFSARFDVATEQVETHNVVAVKRGVERPDETVLFTAHWDHIGIGAPDANGDRIFNGAVDNASGIAGQLELARAFGQAPATRRSVVMISFTAEESGLLGSEFYAANPLFPLAKTVGGINMDSANVYGRVNGFGLVGAGHSQLDDLIRPVVEAQGRAITPERNPAAGSYFRSDHFPLAKRGVPMAYGASAGEFVDEPIAARNAARADYGSRRYHQADDEWSPDWDYSGQIQDLEVYYTVGRGMADGHDWPEWNPTSEFAAARAASADQRR